MELRPPSIPTLRLNRPAWAMQRSSPATLFIQRKCRNSFCPTTRCARLLHRKLSYWISVRARTKRERIWDVGIARLWSDRSPVFVILIHEGNLPQINADGRGSIQKPDREGGCLQFADSLRLMHAPLRSGFLICENRVHPRQNALTSAPPAWQKQFHSPLDSV